MTDTTGRNRSTKTYTLGELADYAKASLKGGDPEAPVRGVMPLEAAERDHVSFLTSNRYVGQVIECRAAAVIVAPQFRDLDRALLVCEQPYLAMARIAQLFTAPPDLESGIHPTAVVEEGVDAAADISVGPLAHIGAGCKIGRRTRIYGGAYLGCRVQVGDDCLIYPRAVILDDCRLGNNVIVHSGAVIGSDGFGFAPDERGRHVKIPQVGIVRIDDDVEIGANCAIDRATFGETRIRRGAKIDNLVQLGHNVVVGEDSILVAQVGIAGSSRLGRNVVLAGQVGVSGHIEIGDRVRVGAKSGISNSVKAGEDVSGYPAVPHKEWLQTCAGLRRLNHFRENLRKLRKRLQDLEEKLNGDRTDI